MGDCEIKMRRENFLPLKKTRNILLFFYSFNNLVIRFSFLESLPSSPNYKREAHATISVNLRIPWKSSLIVAAKTSKLTLSQILEIKKSPCRHLHAEIFTRTGWIAER